MKKTALLSSALLICAAMVLHGQNAGPSGWGNAAWVWDQADAHQAAQNNEPRYLRRVFTLSGKPVQAELWITADNQYTAFVNGQKVGEDGEWNTVEKIDVSKHLAAGKNVLAIQARNQGGQAGIIARLYIKTADNKEVLVVTDAQTRITQTAAKDWRNVDFDDAGWFMAIVLGDASIGPWNLAGSATAAKPGKSYDTNAVDANVKARLSPEEERKHFVVPDGFEVELVAAEPLVINPVTMTVDEQGRIYVSESHTYRYGPAGSPVKPFANPLIRLDPTSDGKGFVRTLIAEGFDDPVMGIAIKGQKLWLTANNYLYQYDLPESSSAPPAKEGLATNKKTILVDKNKAWNPFGMFVLEFGPDGLLYLSVGNHPMNIEGPDGKMSGRGSTGIVMRMQPDGTHMERLVQGLRVPYSFDFDPFGQLWLLSNGEGNPNRFVRVIDGVDYHCYSRPSVDNNWLAGNIPLGPPCEELHRGAHTQLLRYYGAAFPKSYQGSLLQDNWGAHGFAGPNRGIFRFVPDDSGQVIQKEPLLSCTDPHFRPSHIALDRDGNLLVTDWYGRDDESDVTGRIWRLKYTGKDRPTVAHKLDAADWAKDDYALSALGSPHHMIRDKAMTELARRGQSAVAKLSDHAAASPEPLGAAHALWTLLRIGTPEAKAAIASGARHSDAKVRRLAIQLLHRYQLPNAVEVAKTLREDRDPAVRVAAALALPSAADTCAALLDALRNGAADNAHARYEAAWHLAKTADERAVPSLLNAESAEVRLAGLQAIDIACYEDFPTKKLALAALARAVENPKQLDQGLLLTVVQLDGDPSLAPALEKLIARSDVPIATTAKAILLLKAKAGGLAQSFSAAAGKRLIEAVETGNLRIATPADQLMLFEFLEGEGPTPFALKQIAGQLGSTQAPVRQAAHVLARRFGVKSAPLAEQLWSGVLNTGKTTEALEPLATLARIEAAPRAEAWQKLLQHEDPLLRTEAVRWWRNFKGQPAMTDILVRQAPELLKADPKLGDDLGVVFRHLDVKSGLKLPSPETDKAALTQLTAAALADIVPGKGNKRAVLGLQVFERTGCTKCHTTATQTTLLAPSLKGIAAQKIDYLIESVLYPSKIIKTGFEAETVVTADGKVLVGLVKDEGNALLILNVDKSERIPKTDVESRAVSRISTMPEGQETQLSRREFIDLIAFLASLK